MRATVGKMHVSEDADDGGGDGGSRTPNIALSFVGILCD
jgi:hypothetical protein